jgi:predicted nucleotidyltransferase
MTDENVQQLLSIAVAALLKVQGVKAIVLGGSHATGKARPDSDLDIGIYYCESSPLDIDQVRQAADALSPIQTPLVTPLYGWGQWVNGGAWIHTAAGRVDFLYRNIEQVQRAIADAHQGIMHHDYGQQPPFGFWSVMYLAETSVCMPLSDPDGILAPLKRSVAKYPPLLKQGIVSGYLAACEFNLVTATTPAKSADVYGVVGTLTRTFGYLTQVLYALNEVYFISEKAMRGDVPTFAQAPRGYVSRMEAILSHPGATAAELQRSVQATTALWAETVAFWPAFTSRFGLTNPR